jgi:hypothetical protein
MKYFTGCGILCVIIPESEFTERNSTGTGINDIKMGFDVVIHRTM